MYHFLFPPAMNESSCYSTPTPAFDIVSVLDFHHSTRYEVGSLHYFNLKLLNDIRCWTFFYVYLSSVYNVWWGFFLCLLPVLLIKLLIYLLLSFKSYLYILHDNLLSNMSFVNIFYKSLSHLSSYSLDIVFLRSF